MKILPNCPLNLDKFIKVNFYLKVRKFSQYIAAIPILIKINKQKENIFEQKPWVKFFFPSLK